MKLWRVTVERARHGAEKRDRTATLAVAAKDLEDAFTETRDFLANLTPAADGRPPWRIVSAATCLVPVEVLEGRRNLDLTERPEGEEEA